MININYGTGETAVLSNLCYRPFLWDGKQYYSVEHAYQTNKSGRFDPENHALYVQHFSSSKKGRKIQSRKRVDRTISSTLMETLIKESFKQNPGSLKALLNTGNELLTHRQGDSFWSREFPRILMITRADLATPDTGLVSPVLDASSTKNVNLKTKTDVKSMSNLNNSFSVQFDAIKGMIAAGSADGYTCFDDEVAAFFSSKDLNVTLRKSGWREVGYQKVKQCGTYIALSTSVCPVRLDDTDFFIPALHRVNYSNSNYNSNDRPVTAFLSGSYTVKENGMEREVSTPSMATDGCGVSFFTDKGGLDQTLVSTTKGLGKRAFNASLMPLNISVTGNFESEANKLRREVYQALVRAAAQHKLTGAAQLDVLVVALVEDVDLKHRKDYTDKNGQLIKGFKVPAMYLKAPTFKLYVRPCGIPKGSREVTNYINKIAEPQGITKADWIINHDRSQFTNPVAKATDETSTTNVVAEGFTNFMANEGVDTPEDAASVGNIKVNDSPAPSSLSEVFGAQKVSTTHELCLSYALAMKSLGVKVEVRKGKRVSLTADFVSAAFLSALRGKFNNALAIKEALLKNTQLKTSHRAVFEGVTKGLAGISSADLESILESAAKAKAGLAGAVADYRAGKADIAAEENSAPPAPEAPAPDSDYGDIFANEDDEDDSICTIGSTTNSSVSTNQTVARPTNTSSSSDEDPAAGTEDVSKGGKPGLRF